jgi:hypothetical protein
MPARKIDLENIRNQRKSKTKGETLKPPVRPKLTPFAPIALHWLPMVQEAYAQNGLTLLAAIAYRMNGRDRVVIDAGVWELAGAEVATEGKRRAMLDALKRLRHIVVLDFAPRLGRPKYTARKGLWWDKAPHPLNGE